MSLGVGVLRNPDQDVLQHPDRVHLIETVCNLRRHLGAARRQGIVPLGADRFGQVRPQHLHCGRRIGEIPSGCECLPEQRVVDPDVRQEAGAFLSEWHSLDRSHELS